MFKVHILDQCPHCNGQAMLPVGEGKDHKGRTYTRYPPCPNCDGSGNKPRWVSLEEFAQLLQSVQCPHEHVVTNGSMHYADGDVWDDYVQVCSDCGVTLD